MTRLYLNMGKQGFVDAKERSLPLSDTSFPIAVGDMDGDGFPDFVSKGRVYINDGYGRFRLPTKPSSTQFPQLRQLSSAHKQGGAGLADVDGGGDLDYLFISGIGFTSDPLLLRRSLNQGNGTLGELDLVRMPETRTTGFASADIDLDGDLDIITGRTFDS